MDPRVKCDQCENEATVHDTTIQKGAVVERHLCEGCAREAGLMPPGEPPPQTMIPFGPGQIIITSGPFSNPIGSNPLGPGAPGKPVVPHQGKPPAKSPAKPANPAASPPSGTPAVPSASSTNPDEAGAAEPSDAPVKGPNKGKVVVVSGAASPKVDPCPVCGMTYADFKRTGLMGCESCYKAFERPLLPLIERAHEGGSFHLGKTPKRLATSSPERLALALAEAEARAQRIRGLMRELDVAIASEKYELAAKLRDQLRRLQQAGPHMGETQPGGASSPQTP